MEEILDIVRAGNPRSSLTHAIDHRAIVLRQIQSDIQARSPRLIRVIVDTTTHTIYIIVTILQGKSLIIARISPRLRFLPIILGSVIALSVLILQSRQIINPVNRDITLIRDRYTLVFLTGFSSNQDNAITGTHTIQSGRSTLQHRDGLYILRINIIQAGTQVYSGTFRIIISDRHTVHNDQRLVITKRGITANHDILRRTNLSTLRSNLHTGDLTGK